MQALGLSIAITIFILLDLYVFRLLKDATVKSHRFVRRALYIVYWFFTAVVVTSFIIGTQLDPFTQRFLRVVLFSIVFISITSKLLSGLFLFIEDIVRGIQWIMKKTAKKQTEEVDESRSGFLRKTALVVGSLPTITMGFGIGGAYDYRVRKKTLYFKDLPKAFDGIKVAQLSDIHSGSFYNKKAVLGGINTVLSEKPDAIFFTGDLVNDQSKEVEEYIDVFSKLDAPLGVYSVMGNHDYGDYRRWPSAQAKQRDIQNLHKAHELMGWDLLLNENRVLKVDGEEIALLGVENWGKGRFSKYGDLAKTYEGVADHPFKILLSHDPSHWDAEIRPKYSDIDLTLSGHTHGFQFGVEIGDFRWSPSKYIYKQWADLYQEGEQYIYVNRGFGFIGYPGRVGILPEITMLELKRS